MLQLPEKYLRHCHAQMQNLASDAQLLPPHPFLPLPTHPFPFLITLHRPCPKHCPTILKKRGGTCGGGGDWWLFCGTRNSDTDFWPECRNNFAANCRCSEFRVLCNTINVDLSLIPAHQHTFWQLMSGFIRDERCLPTLLTEMLKSFLFARYFRPCFQFICRTTTHLEG